jgi:hypothetical protein
MATTPESKVKKACKRLLDAAGIWHFSPIGGAFATHGVPDIVCVAPGDHVFFIETKAPGKIKNLTENQKRVHDEIRIRGGTVLVVDDLQPVKEYIDALQSKNPRHEAGR